LRFYYYNFEILKSVIVLTPLIIIYSLLFINRLIKSLKIPNYIINNGIKLFNNKTIFNILIINLNLKNYYKIIINSNNPICFKFYINRIYKNL
jgi:hypothetical protein